MGAAAWVLLRGSDSLAQGLRLRSGQGLSGFGSGPPPCDPNKKPTPAAAAGPDYKAGAPERTSLLEPGLAGTRTVITGTVSGVTCGLIKRALLEFWQADASGVYDRAGMKLRGRQYTDANGAFRLETIVPGSTGKRAPRIHVRVTPPGKPAFTTQLFFPDLPQNKTDAEFKTELQMTAAATRGGVKNATFDLLLDI